METNGWAYVYPVDLMTPTQQLSFEELTDDIFEEGKIYVDLSPYSPLTPEDIAIQKERWDSLKQEVREVIEMIGDCPAEIIETMRVKKSGITAKKLVRYLYKIWGDKKAAVDAVMGVYDYLEGEEG